MNNLAKAGMLTIALGAVFASADSKADLVAYGSAAAAPARCQAFTPGVTNTIRNRIIGSENVGDNPISVVCDFEAGVSNNSTNVLAVSLWFSSLATTGPISFNCTMITGWQGADGAVAVNKVSAPVVNGGGQQELAWDATDMPAGSTDLGFSIIGVNCTVPKGGVINDTYVYWGDEDGIGA